MGLPNYKNYFSETEYLDFELHSNTKHEYFDGDAFAMSGGSQNHQLLTMNVASECHQHLKGTPCKVFQSDMKVRVDDGNKYFYPDVVVTCEQENEAYFLNAPRLVIEVLSKSTREYDQNLKRSIYQTIQTLEEYVLIEKDSVKIEVFRKADDWQSSCYFLNDEITFTSIDLTLPVVDIYQRVDNEDMRVFLQKPSN